MQVDLALKLLADRTRRQVIQLLMTSESGNTTVRNLAAGLDTEQDTEITLHHHHLPMLAEANLVEFDSASGRVRYLGDEFVEELLDLL